MAGAKNISPEEAMSRDIAAPVRQRDIPWWIVLLQGIAGLVIGLLLLTQPGLTILTLVVFLGVYWLVGGVFDIVGIFIDHTNWGWRLFTGILGILAGLLIVRNPLWAGIVVPTTLVWLLALIGVVIGGVNILRAFTGAGWGAGIVGAISIVLGIILLTRPLISLSILVYVIAFWAIAGGIAAIIGAFWLRSNPRAAGLTPAGWIL